MSASSLARWQFGITTVYHFLFVPLTIGLSILVASVNGSERTKPSGVDIASVREGRRTVWRVQCPRCGHEIDGWWLPKQYKRRTQAAAVAHAHRERHRLGYAA